MTRLEQLYNKLGLNEQNGLFLLKDSNKWLHKLPYRISRILKEVIKPSAIFCVYSSEQSSLDHPKPFNQSFLLFFDNPTEEEEALIHKRIINFGLCQAVFINRPTSLSLYHGNEFSFTGIQQLKRIRQSNSIDDFKEFSFINILLGKSLEMLGPKKDLIDSFLLRNITDARRILVAKNGLKLLPKAASRLIGRLLFVSYLIDRGVTFSDQEYVTGENKVERKKSFRQLINTKTRLYKFFKYLNTKYNGDMFPLIENNGITLIYDEENLITPAHLEIVYHLFNCSSFFKSGSEQFKGYTVQKSLFDLYDFEIIPVELISSIYENFIGNEYENEKVNLTKQKQIKAYYTPPYIVDYILSQTVVPFLHDPYKKDSNCRVLDPSCGSGIFLVETLRKIIEKELITTKGRKITDKKLWRLVKSNLFGIDIDSDAIDITIFSLYITILDYKKPAEIENFKFERLKDENLFGGHDADFFNIDHPYNTIVAGIDFIIGNPPWGQVKNSRYVQYIKDRDRLEKEHDGKSEYVKLEIGDKEICQAFLVRTSDFHAPTKKIKCSFVVSSKVLYNTENSSKAFRNYFLRRFYIDQVVELSPVNNKIRGGNHIFDNAKQPAAILTFRPGIERQPTSENITQHITIKPNRFFLQNRTIVIQKHDVKKIKQQYFIEDLGGYDWMWKVLVHGNALDIHFLRRLKDRFDPASKYFEKHGYVAKGGLKIVDGDKTFDTTKILDYDFLDAENDFQPYIAVPSKKWKHQVENESIDKGNVGYLPNLRFFEGNKLLIKKGLVLQPRETDHFFQAVSVFNAKRIVFTSTVCSVIPSHPMPKENSKAFLSTLSALFNSKLFTYFLLNTSSSAGIERTRVHFREFFQFPVVLDDKLGELALSITNRFDDFGSEDIKKSKEKIEKIIYRLYNIDDMEKSLIDYAMQVSIPTLLRDTEASVFQPLRFKEKRGQDYIQPYVNSFKKIFDHRLQKMGKKLHSQILYNEYFLRINFFFETAEYQQLLIVENHDLETMIGDLGVYAVCKDLYMQQDVRGFTKSSFYIIKPNEKKLWHEAVGYLDAIEFEEEITKAEIKQVIKKEIS